MQFKFLIFEGNDDKARSLAQTVQECPSVEVVNLPEASLWRFPGLDAIYVTPPMAERWGALPILETAQLLETSEEERRTGLPRFVISGVALRGDDRRTPPELVRLVTSAVRDAVTRAHEERGANIQTVGIASRHLLVDSVPGRELRQAMCSHANST